ncbi:Fic family protein [Xanthomonas translucens pv. translucens]|nr:Fic family protein [Xanthomonas translucens pv. translucens]
MDGNTKLAPLDLSFVPSMGRRDAASAKTWLDAAFSVYTPAPLELPIRSNEGVQDYGRFGSDVQSVSYLAAITARLSQVCRGIRKPIAASDLRASPSVTNAIRSALNAGLPDARGLLDWSLALAKSIGHGQVRRRSDNAWIGGQSPATAWLVLPPADRLPGLMEKLDEFLRIKDHGAINCAYFEAVAYQLLCIHPLSDTNGRTARTLLTNLAVRYRNLYPIYVAHCLCFAKERAGNTWMQASMSGCGAGQNNSAAWLNVIQRILDKIFSLLEAGLDQRALWSLLTYGYVSKETLCAGKHQCSPSLAEKIIFCLPAILDQEQGMFHSTELEILIVRIDRSINREIYESK